MSILIQILTAAGTAFAIIFTVWRMTRDVRTNFKSKVEVSVCEKAQARFEKDIRSVHGRMNDLHKHIDTRFDDLKDLIKAGQK